MADPEPKRCFVICPIGAQGSPERRWSDDIYNNLIRPIAEEFGFDARRNIDRERPGDITVQIMEEINLADLVVADLTGHNPNVFYELAAAHALGKPFILLRGDDLRHPFDVGVHSVIDIKVENYGDTDTARDRLRTHFRAVQNDEANFENPFTRYKDRVRVETEGTPVEKRLSDIDDKISALIKKIGKPETSIEDAIEEAYDIYLAQKFSEENLSDEDLSTLGRLLGRNFVDWLNKTKQSS